MHCFRHPGLGSKHRLDVAELLLAAGADTNVKIEGALLLHHVCQIVHPLVRSEDLEIAFFSLPISAPDFVDEYDVLIYNLSGSNYF
jgi:hypothetical protein